jgi:hypothetical protein
MPKRSIAAGHPVFRALLAVAIACILTGPLRAGGGRSWIVESGRDFAGGEGSGIRFDPDGGIGPALERTEIARFPEESNLFCAVRAAGGDLYLGTGFAGAVYRLPRAGGGAAKVANLEESALFALAAGPKGEVWAAGSPGGKIYRVDPVAGQPPVRLVAETGEATVWALAFEPTTGGLLAATGDQGKLLRITGLGGKTKIEVLLDSAEPNIRVLLPGRGGKLFAGTDGRALVYEIDRVGKARVVVDSAKGEISGLLERPDGSLLVLATTGNSLLQPPPAPPKGASAGQAGGAQGALGGDVPQGIVTVSVETSTTPAAGAPSRQAFEILRVRPDGAVESLGGGDDEIGFALAEGATGKPWIAAGPKGRIWELDGRSLSIVREIPEKNALFLLPGEKGTCLVGGADGPALHRIGPALDGEATYRSVVHAEDRPVRWGAFRAMVAPGGGKIELSFRSGGSPVPDDTWSGWLPVSGTEGDLPVPPSRYVQWKALFRAPRGSGPAPFLRTMSVVASPANLPPVIEQLNVYDPGVIFVRGTYGSGNVVVEAANPDEKGMFTIVGESKDRSDFGKRMFRKGFRTLLWKAADPNDDPLLSDLFFRPCDEKGSPQGEWMRVAKDLVETGFAFDASVLPDGWYLFEVRTSDRKANLPGESLEDRRTSAPVAIDNTAPEVKVEPLEGGATAFRVRVRDSLSPLLRAERAVDGGDWVLLPSEDGSVDEREESFRFEASGADGRPPRMIVFRVLDSSYNVTTTTCRPSTGASGAGGR